MSLEKFICSAEGLVYSGNVFVGFIVLTKHGERYFSVRDGYQLSSQGLLEIKHLLDNYGGV